ncbi:MAG: hypothetical protein PHU23_18210 [Dehalococcoidales bacterium]|nr:hypothetical protein [Dehalococcoidales bacterium]
MDNISAIPLSWEDSLKTLSEYISSNDQIKIKENYIEIAEENKEEFYTLFNKVRSDFVTCETGELLDKANCMIDQYQKSKDYIKKSYDIKDIAMSQETLRFLDSPQEELRRPLFDLLFKLMAGTITVLTFREEAMKAIWVSFCELYSSVYEVWLLLSMIKTSRSKRIFTIDNLVIDESRFSKARMSRIAIGNVASVPEPQIANEINFSKAPLLQFVVPDMIIETQGIFLAMKRELPCAIMIAQHHDQTREWLKRTPSMEGRYQNHVFIYIGNSIEQVSLVADDYSICRPDCIIINQLDRESLTTLKCQELDKSSQNLTPHLGTYFNSIFQSSNSTNVFPQVEVDGARYVNLGLDESRIQNLMHSMIQTWLTRKNRNNMVTFSR